MQRGERGLFDVPERRDIGIRKTDDCSELILDHKVLEAPVYLICAYVLKAKK